MTAEYCDIQVMMTLAALAATATTPLPGGGETVGAQQLRILRNINQQLSNPDFATAGEWEAVWVGLTDDRANMSYLAQNTQANQYALSVRGTVPADVNNWAEDLDVGVVLALTEAGPTPLMVSQGALQAFNEVSSAVFQPPLPQALAGTTLVEALASRLGAGPPGATVYVTGHSLGGATATTVALYLVAQTWTPNPPTFQVITYAAPTAGLADFASAFSEAFPNSVRVYNAYDVVPNAWQSLGNLDGYFPAPGGPSANSTYLPTIVGDLLTRIAGLPYSQPSPNPFPINTLAADTYLFDKCHIGGHGGLTPKLDNTKDYVAQIAYQHSSATYLMLLGAPAPPLYPPVVTAVSPPSLPATGGAVTISGRGFTGATAVYFGVAPAAGAISVNSDNEISATAPAGAGTVHVTVVTTVGTSATSADDEVVYPPMITALAPSSGPLSGGAAVTVFGSGFTGATAVQFGSTSVPSDQITVVADNQITATVPAANSAGVAAVTVTTPVGSSAASGPAFTYLAAATAAPAVDGINPTGGPTSGGTPVTISGSGFGGASAVNFGTTPAAGFIVVSDDTVIASAPSMAAVTVDVTVTSAAGTSSTGTDDEFTYSAPSSPSVTTFFPTSGPHDGGTTVTISGGGFTGATSVEFGTKEAACFAIDADGQITAVSPGAGLGVTKQAVAIVVITPGGTVTTTANFTYEAPKA